MVELELTSSKILVGGIAAILTGILLAIGADIWSIAKDWMLTPTLDLRFLISVSLLVLGIIGVAYALHAMLREEIVGVTAHLFFPSEAAIENRTTKFYKDNNYRHNGLIVNHKTGMNRPIAYYLPVNSYPWRVLEKQPAIMVPEVDTTNGHPDYVKWCADRNYILIPKVAGKEDLLASTVQYIDESTLDARLRDVEYRYFISFYDLLKKRFLPPRRIILNWSSKMAYVLDSWTMRLVVEGKIRGQTIMMLKPTFHYAQKWAKRQGFEWSEKLATMDDLLAKKHDDHATAND
jgi:hypothetical protein